jgi:hypothetical protein
VSTVPSPSESQSPAQTEKLQINSTAGGALCVIVALGVALFSYDDRLFWGFNGDWDLVPDLHHFANDVETSLDELHAIASTTEVRAIGGRRLSSP